MGKDATGGGASADQLHMQDEADYGDDDDETQDQYEETKDGVTPTSGVVGGGSNKRHN